MADFEVSTAAWSKSIQGLDSMATDISASIKSVNRIRSDLTVTQVSRVLDVLAQHLSDRQREIQDVSQILSQIKQLYEQTETDLCNLSIEKQEIEKVEKSSENTINWLDGLDKASLKTLLDILGNFGDTGKTSAVLIALLKILIDGDGFTAKDFGALIKGVGNTAMGLNDLLDHYIEYMFDSENTENFLKMFGLNTCKTIAKDSAAAWYKNAGKTFWDTFRDKLGIDVEKGGLKSTAIAGWALTAVADGFSNYDEFDGFSSRMVGETVTETLIDIGKGAGVAAAVAAGFAAAGVAAPAVAVAGVAAVITAGADYVCKKITGKTITEGISDLFWDSKAGQAIIGGAENAKNAVAGWFDGMSSMLKHGFAF